MRKLKPTYYFVILLSSLILSIVYLNILLNYKAGNLRLASEHTGALSAIPATTMPSNYAITITLLLIFAGYFAWVWSETEKLKKSSR